MSEITRRHLLGYNMTRIYSPLTMSSEWSTLWRLILIVLLTVTGTIINGFFIASFFIEENLRRAGNVYLACVGIADIIITTVVMPAAVAVLISKEWDIEAVCRALQFITQASTYTYSLLFMMVAIENYIRLCRTRACYQQFLSIGVAFISITIFIISFAVSAVGVYLEMDYNYCTRESFGNYTFRLLTSLFFHGIPCVFTVVLLFSSSLVVRARARRLVHYKRSKQYDRDYAFTNLNLGCYCLFATAWLPYLVLVNQYPDTADSNFYNSVWFGMSRSIISSFIYSGLNSNFRRAFAHLFYYCCCKTSLSVPLNHRNRRTCDYKVTSGNVRVHIMHHSMVHSSPHRAGRFRERARDSELTTEI